MRDFNFKKWNLILGWTAFTLAFVVYAMTVEPTVGFWDTGEYILTSSKLEVGHPPGAPLFQMLGAFFSIFASEPAQIGLVLNMMSAAASAFTILFMFWSIVLLLKKLTSLGSCSIKIITSKTRLMICISRSLTTTLFPNQTAQGLGYFLLTTKANKP